MKIKFVISAEERVERLLDIMDEQRLSSAEKSLLLCKYFKSQSKSAVRSKFGKELKTTVLKKA